MTPSDILNLGTHGTLMLVIFWLLKSLGETSVRLTELGSKIDALKAEIDAEIAATGGFSSRNN